MGKFPRGKVIFRPTGGGGGGRAKILKKVGINFELDLPPPQWYGATRLLVHAFVHSNNTPFRIC